MYPTRCPQCNSDDLYILVHGVHNNAGTFYREFRKLMCNLCGHCVGVLTST
jgi:hypothetical protein